MRVRNAWVLALAMAACFGKDGDHAPAATATDLTPVTRGHWTYYGGLQGLSPDVQDVSADEGGNVYVAGGDALYVKRRTDQSFLRFDAANAGLTKNCNDAADILVATPAKPFYQCRILAVAGASPGKAIIGFEGFGYLAVATDWAIHAGGADVVAFDPDKGALARTRHVFLASPPHIVCGGAEARGPVASSARTRTTSGGTMAGRSFIASAASS